MDEESVSVRAPWEFLALLLVGLAMYLAFAGILAFVSRRRRRRKLAKIFVAVLAGAACGALWILLIRTVVNAARPGARMDPAVLIVGVVTGLSTAVLLSRLGRLREVVGRSWMITGFHSLALPIAALVAFLVGGAQLSPAGNAKLELSAAVLGVRLAGSPATVGLSVGGFLMGLSLVWVGDRMLRRARRGTDQVRAGHQPQDRQGPRPDDPPVTPAAGGSGD